MSKAKPTIQKFMTYQPVSINENETLHHAKEIMALEFIRHLPVVDKNKIVGILTDRDVSLALSLSGVDPKKTLVKDICHRNVFTVGPDSHLEDVVSEMAKHSYGCALVVQNERLVGIFTTVDVCRTLAKIIGESK